MTILESKRRRLPVGLLIRIALGGGILYFLATRIDWGAMSLTWDSRARIGFASTVLILFIAQLLSAVRWKLVLGREAGTDFSYLTRLYLIGTFFSFFLPTSVGGDGVRAVALSRASARPSWALTSVVLERALGLIAMFALLALGGLLAPAVLTQALGVTTFNFDPSLMQIAIALVIGVAAAFAAWQVIRRSEKLRKLAGEAFALLSGLAARPRDFAAALLVSALVQLAYAIGWYVMAGALRLPVPAVEFLVFVPFVSIAAMLPVTVAGVGLREGAWVVLLASHGVASANAVAFSLLYFVAFLSVGALGGLLFALKGIDRTKSLTPNAPALQSVAAS